MFRIFKTCRGALPAPSLSQTEMRLSKRLLKHEKTSLSTRCLYTPQTNKETSQIIFVSLLFASIPGEDVVPLSRATLGSADVWDSGFHTFVFNHATPTQRAAHYRDYGEVL